MRIKQAHLMRTTSAAAVLFLLALCAKSSNALSYPACDNLAAEYVTDSPRLTGSWPYYNLLYTCSGNITLEGYPVDACVSSGKSCGQAAADAFCQYLGFDNNAPGLYSTVTAKSPAISITGEWCVSAGKYEDDGHPNRTSFENLQAQNPGPYCSVLSSVSCLRSRATMAAEVERIKSVAAQAPATPPNSQLVPGAQFLLANAPPVATAGRRMKGVASICA